MAPKTIRSNYRILVGIDPSQLKQYSSQIQEELNKNVPKATIRLNTVELRKDVAEAKLLLDQLHSPVVTIDFSKDALKNFESFATEVTDIFTKNTAAKIAASWNQVTSGMTAQVNRLKEKTENIRKSAEEVAKSVVILKDSFSGKNANIVNNVSDLEKNVKSLSVAFGTVDRTSEDFVKLKKNVEAFTEAVQPLSNTILKDPVEFKVKLPDIKTLKADIKEEYIAFRDAIYEDANFALRLKAIPTIAVSKNGGEPTVFIDAEVSKISLRRSIATNISALNESKDYPKLRIDIDRDYFTKQFAKVFDLKLSITNFEDTENRIKELRTLMNELRDDAKLTTGISGDIPSGKIQISDINLENTDRILSGISQKIGRIIEYIGALSTYSSSYIPSLNNEINSINVSSEKENILLQEKIKLVKQYEKAYLNAYSRYLKSGSASDKFAMQSSIEGINLALGDTVEEQAIKDIIINRIYSRQEELDAALAVKKAAAATAEDESKVQEAITKEKQNYKDAKDLLNQIYDLKNKIVSLDSSSEKYQAINSEISKLEERYKEIAAGLSNKKIDELTSLRDKKQGKFDTNSNIKYAESLDKIKANAINTGTELTKLLTTQRNVSQYIANLGKDYNNLGFDNYLQNVKELATLYKEIETISNGKGNVNRLPELQKRADILKNSVKDYEAALREANASLGAQDKNFDKLTNTASELSRYMNEYGTRIKRTTDLYEKFVELQKDVFGRKIGNNEAQRRLNDLTMKARAAGVEVESLWTKLQKTFAGRFRALVAGQGLFLVQSAVRQIYQNVLELDTAMTELKKVTDETADSYVKFLDNAETRAKRLGATLVDVVSATSDFARLGFGLEDASSLADSALIYKNVGDGIESIDDATSSIISTMQAFNIQAEDSMQIVDKFNAIGNQFATTSGDVGEALKRSASAMQAANNSLDQTIALYTAAQTSVQDADVVGGEMCPAA